MNEHSFFSSDKSFLFACQEKNQQERNSAQYNELKKQYKKRIDKKTGQLNSIHPETFIS